MSGTRTDGDQSLLERRFEDTNCHNKHENASHYGTRSGNGEQSDQNGSVSEALDPHSPVKTESLETGILGLKVSGNESLCENGDSKFTGKEENIQTDGGQPLANDNEKSIEETTAASVDSTKADPGARGEKGSPSAGPDPLDTGPAAGSDSVGGQNSPVNVEETIEDAPKTEAEMKPEVPPKTEDSMKSEETEEYEDTNIPERAEHNGVNAGVSELTGSENDHLKPPQTASGLTPQHDQNAPRRTSSSVIPGNFRKSSSAKVDNTAIFKKTFESILQSKEAQKNDVLKTATQKAIDLLDNLASRDPHVLFEALKLSCQTPNTELKCKAVDLFAKLFDYALFDDEGDRTRLTDASVDVISTCFEGEGTDADLELQVVRALTHSIVLMPTHGASLLKAVRLIYNVFIFSLTLRNQAVAQGTLAQVVNTIFQRVSEANPGLNADASAGMGPGVGRARTPQSTSDVNISISVDPEATAETETGESAESAELEGQEHPKGAAETTLEVPAKVTLEELQNLSADSADHDRVKEANSASEKDDDLAVKDVFLVFRAMCKLSAKDLDTDNVDMRSHAVRSKLLSLHVIHTILRNNIDIFLSKNVVILSSNSDDQTRLLDAVRSYLCQALIRNAASALAPVFELTLETFWLLTSNLRMDFKMEIPVLWEQIYLPVAEMKTSTPHQKRYLLSVIERLCNDLRCIIEFYLNYDCDSSQPNMCETIIDYLTRLSLLRVEVTAAQKAAFQEKRGSGISLYDVSKIDNLTSSTMPSKPPEADIYALFPLEYAMKITSLNCSVAFLRSLYSWAQKGFLSSQKLLANGMLKIAPSGSSYSTQNISRNPSFVGNQQAFLDTETDDPDQFETQKQRKKALVEGARQFSQKPKKGITYFVEHAFIPSDSPEDIATFLLSTEALDKAALGDFLGDGSEKNVAIMHALVDQMDFESSSFVDSLRTFLQLFRLPGEGQKIDRFMLKFAERYVLGNPGVFSNADTAYVLAYSAVMLNTDQHSRLVKNRMTVDNFIVNNAGIDDGKDLPREFLEQVFAEIQSNEIKLQSEHHAALLAGDQSLAVAATGPTSFFGSRDWSREAYIHASKEMSTKTEKLVKNLGRKMRAEDSPSQIYYAASNVQHVKSIFDTMWMSILAGLTGPYKEYNRPDIVKLCLEGIKLSIRISCMFGLHYAKKSFIGALVQFQNLNNIEDIRAKNVDAMHVMLDIAVGEGNYLQGSWIDVLTSISQLERLQLIAKGIDRDSIPDVSTVKLVNRNSVDSASPAAQHTGFFSLFTRETSASQTASIKYHNQQLSAESAQLLSRTELSVAVDRVFTNSAELSGDAIKDFVEALSRVASEEIDSLGQLANPRMFSLQKVVDICYYNMGRIRLEWLQLWVALGEIFRDVGCNRNLAVAFFSLDSLRQLSMRFMDIEELAHFKFQKEFLKPFQHIITHNSSPEVKDMVLECMNNMVLAKACHIKSGWKTIFEVLTEAARSKKDVLVTKAYKLAFTINKEFSDAVIAQDSFAELVTCFTQFAKNEQLQKVGLLSLEVLSRLIVRVAKSSIELNSKDPISAKRDVATEKYDSLMKLWFPLLYGFYDIVMSGEELEVRSRTLTHFFDTLLKYGDHFATNFWDIIYQKLLAPIFGVIASPWALNYDDESAQYGGSLPENDRMSFWVSTTFIQALNGMVSLFSHYFDALTPSLDDLLTLLVSCICQENDTIARTGKACLQEFLVQNCHKFKQEHWRLTLRIFERLFDLTTAKELFILDPLRAEDSENSEMESLNINNLDGSPNTSATRGSDINCDKSSIVVKCVLQLLMIETVLELLAKDEFYEAIPEKHIFDLAMLPRKSCNFAKKFNDDYDLRVRLYNARIIERLPNLLKQESMAAAVFLNVTFRLYCDDKKATTRESKQEIMDSVVPLCYSIVTRFCDLDETNQKKSIATWKPVITEIFEGFVEMDEDDFAAHAPQLYRLTLGMFDHSMGADLRKALQMFMARVGDVFLKKM